MEEKRAKLRKLEERLADLHARLPKHSTPAAMLIEMEELEEEIAHLRRELASPAVAEHAMPNALEILKTATDSYAPCLREDGEIVDPVLGVPFQYGTPYHALCNAVLALKLTRAQSGQYRRNAMLGLEASLRHVLHTELPPLISSVDRDLGEMGRLNHRDFFWPPILKTYVILRELGEDVERLAPQIRAVEIERAFRSRPPSNWAMVWLLGEWIRIREGLSPHSRDELDDWLAVFFAHHIDIEKGFYHEPGHPNSYDLFTRYHLAALWGEGYDGRFCPKIEALMETGLRRSLAVQLSDGSLASAYRSTGLTWTLGVECAYFVLAARFFQQRDPVRSQLAHAAARRALGALARWQRPGARYSPVENCLPADYRVGYERYTTEANHGTLPIAALALAVLNGFAAEPLPDSALREPQVWLEHDPIYRALAHCGPYSLHFNAFPSPEYDGFGIVDMTFGPNRYFHFVSSVRSLHSGRFVNLGLAHKADQIEGPLTVIARQDKMLVSGFHPIQTGDRVGFALEARGRGEWYIYRASMTIGDDGIRISEETPGLRDFKSLLIPYLRDAGRGIITQVFPEQEIRFVHGDEEVRIALEQKVERCLHLTYGYENRRGLCGLLRVDLTGEQEGIAYRIYRVR